MIEQLKAALAKHAAIHGYSNDAARVLKGEIDAREKPYPGAGATTIGNDALIDWIEETYQVQLEETRLKRWKVNEQEAGLQQQAEDDAARRAEQDAIQADRDRIAKLKAEKGADWWIGVDHIEADVPAGILRDRLLNEFCLADFKPSPPHYGQIADDAAPWKKEIHDKLVRHWGQGVMNDFQTRLGPAPKLQPSGPGIVFGEWAGHHLYPTSTPSPDCNLQMWIVAEDEDRADRYEVSCDGWTGMSAAPSAWTHYEDLYCLPATLLRTWDGNWGPHTVTVRAMKGGAVIEEISRTVWLRPFFMSYRKKEGGEWHEQNVVSDDDSARFDEYTAWRALADGSPAAPEETDESPPAAGGATEETPPPAAGSEAEPDAHSLPATVPAPRGGGEICIVRPDSWTGKGKVQVGGGAKALNRSSFSGLRIEEGDDRTFFVRWNSRQPGRLAITLEWQPVAGDRWQPSDGGPVEPRVLTVVNEGGRGHLPA